MGKFDWKATLATVAPALATALGGPLAGIAMGEVSRAVLGRDGGDDAEVGIAVAAGGADVLVKLKEADHAFDAKMRELEIDLDRIHQADRASARDREAKTGDKTPAVLAGVITVGFFAVLAYMLDSGLPDSGREALLVMLGALGGAWGSVVSYYYGTTRGSTMKTQLLADRRTD